MLKKQREIEKDQKHIAIAIQKREHECQIGQDEGRTFDKPRLERTTSDKTQDDARRPQDSTRQHNTGQGAGQETTRRNKSR